jgi:hypothetical protein
MDEGRKYQLECWRSWTPDRRFRAAMAMTDLVLELRDRNLAIMHPEAGPEEIKKLRMEATLRASPSLRP